MTYIREKAKGVDPAITKARKAADKAHDELLNALVVQNRHWTTDAQAAEVYDKKGRVFKHDLDQLAGDIKHYLLVDDHTKPLVSLVWRKFKELETVLEAARLHEHSHITY